MNLTRLTIAGQQSVTGTFDYSACLVGDAVLWNVNIGGKPVGPIQATVAPDAGDDAPPNIEVLDDSLLGVTSKGRKVLAFRSGNRKPNSTEWDGTSSLYIGVGAASNLRPSSQAVVVQTTQPGPQGPKGDKGDTGAVGPSGAPGAPGGDAEVDEPTMQRIAALTAEQVLLGAPAGDHYGLPANAQFGTRFQENLAIMLVNQALWQEVVKAIDTAVFGLASGGYEPKVK